MQDKLLVSCGIITKLANHILTDYGYKSRITISITLNERKTFNDAHNCIEVYRNEYEKWILYDLDNNAYFTHEGIPLSLIEFVDYSSSGDYDINYIANDTRIDVVNWLFEDYNWSFLGEMNTADLKEYYKRVMQVSLLKDGDYFFFYDKENQTEIESYSTNFKYMDEEEFFNKFYLTLH